MFPRVLIAIALVSFTDAALETLAAQEVLSSALDAPPTVLELRAELRPPLLGLRENSGTGTPDGMSQESSVPPGALSRAVGSQGSSSASERARVGFLIGALVGGGITYVLCTRTDDCPVRYMTPAAAGIGGLLGAGFGLLADPDNRRKDE